MTKIVSGMNVEKGTCCSSHTKHSFYWQWCMSARYCQSVKTDSSIKLVNDLICGQDVIVGRLFSGRLHRALVPLTLWSLLVAWISAICHDCHEYCRHLQVNDIFQYVSYLTLNNNNLLTVPQLSLALSAKALRVSRLTDGTPSQIVVNRLNLLLLLSANLNTICFTKPMVNSLLTSHAIKCFWFTCGT